MSQFARPDSTIDNTWGVNPSGSAHTVIDESSLDTADYIDAGVSSAVCEVGLSNVTDPNSSSGHVIHVVRAQTGTINNPTVELYQGGSDGTLIVSRTLPAGAQSEFTYTLSSGEANSITDYTDLTLYFFTNGGSGTYTIYQAFLEVPDADQVLTGATFAKAKTFPAGSTITGGAATLIGATFLRAGSFARGWLGGQSYIPSAVLEMDTSELKNGARLDVDSLDSGATLDYSELTWSEDLTSYLRRGNVDRGAERELQRIDAGTAEFVIDNRTGILTNARPMLRFRLQAVWQGVFYPVITGFSESLEITFPGEGDQIITVSITDGFKIIAQELISGDFPQQSSGDRIAAILQAISWPAPFTSIDQGIVDVPATTLENISALEHIQQVEYAEGGRFFMSRDGVATFRDRTQPTPNLSTRTWADDGSGMSYRDLAVRRNDDLVLNLVKLTRPGGVEQVAEDLDSQGRYGIRPLVQEIGLATDGEVLERAEFFVTRYSEAERRIERLVDNAMRHQLWDRVLERELADAVGVIESQIPVDLQVSSVEGISHEFDFSMDFWTVSLAVSPTEVIVHAILDDPILGTLDEGNVLG